MPNRKLAIGTLTVGVALILSVILNAYFIRTDAGGWALWNAEEAYLFIGSDSLGRHVKWIGYPFLVAGEMVGHIEPPDDSRGSMYVIRVTSAGVERHVFELTDRRPGSGPGMYTPLEGRIWANWPTIGGLCWWAGDHFERATPEEQQRLDGINHLGNKAYTNESGWSKDGLAEGYNSVVKVDDEFELTVYGGGTGRGTDGILIEMRKQGSEPTKVFSLDARVGRVSRSEYRRTFPDSK